MACAERAETRKSSSPFGQADIALRVRERSIQRPTIMSDDECGVEQGNGEPCDNPVKYADGKCGIHSEINGGTTGRPTKFNDERAQAAIEAAREGKSKRGCERAAGVAEGTIANWEEQGHTFTDESGHTASFFHSFAQARARGESRCIENARREDGDPSFEKFLLASSFDYVKTEKQETEVSGPDGGPIEINIGGDDGSE